MQGDACRTGHYLVVNNFSFPLKKTSRLSHVSIRHESTVLELEGSVTMNRLAPSQMDLVDLAGPSATLVLPSNDEITPAENGQETEKATAKSRVSTLAFISYFLSALSFAGWAVTRIPLPALGALGVLSGLLALIAIRRNPARLEGRTIAWAGIAAGFLNLIAVSGFSISSSEVTYTSFG
jgi:hypothetical protein